MIKNTSRKGQKMFPIIVESGNHQLIKPINTKRGGKETIYYLWS